MRPFIMLRENRTTGNEGFDAYLGTTLASCPASRSREGDDGREARSFMLKQVDFIRSLHNMKPPRAYALRYISKPDPRSFLAGTREVALLVKVSASSKKNAQGLAGYLFEEIRNQLGSMLHEYSWRVIQDEDDFTRVWEPFDLNGAHVVEFRRREDLPQLGANTRRPSLARKDGSGDNTGRAGEVYLVHQYIPRASGLSRFLKVMLLHSSPLLVQISITPTLLGESEEEKINEERANCTRYLGEENPVAFPSGTRTISLRTALEIELLLGMQQLRLQDKPFLLSVAIASPNPVETYIAEDLAIEMTLPAGPVFYQYMQNCLLPVMSDPENPGTILDYYHMFTKPGYFNDWLPPKEEDDLLSNFVEILKKRGRDIITSPDSSNVSLGECMASKFEGFVFDPRLRTMFGQKRSTIDFGDIINEGRILLVNLAKGLLAETNSRFLGMMIVAKLQAEAMRRKNRPKKSRSPFCVYVDEFQSLTTSNFTILLSEGRKFGIGLILANQFAQQIKDGAAREALFGNVGSIICFRFGQADSNIIEPHMLPEFDAYDLTNLNNYNACAKITVSGRVAKPFSLDTLLPELRPGHGRAMRVREASRKKNGRSRDEVLSEIAFKTESSMTTTPYLKRVGFGETCAAPARGVGRRVDHEAIGCEVAPA